MSRYYRFMRRFFMGIFGVLYNIRVIGRENEPSQDSGPLLVCSNHISATDPIAICYAIQHHQVCYMAKKELFRIPGFSLLIRSLGAYPVDRSKSDVGAVRHTIDILSKGGCAGMFPQGTRHPGENPRDTEVKPGAGMISVHTEAAVLPVFIATRGARHKLFRRKYIIIGMPIPFEEFGYVKGNPGEYTRISRIIFDKICDLGEEWNSNAR